MKTPASAGVFVYGLVLQPIAGLEYPPHRQQTGAEDTEDHRQADTDADVRDAVEAPAETADQIHHRIEQGDLLPQRRQHLDGIETAADKETVRQPACITFTN